MGSESLKAGVRELSVVHKAGFSDGLHCGVDGAERETGSGSDIALTCAWGLAKGVQNNEGLLVEHETP